MRKNKVKKVVAMGKRNRGVWQKNQELLRPKGKGKAVQVGREDKQILISYLINCTELM